MPTISTFFGIAVRMYFSDHPPPHFYVSYQRRKAVVAIDPCELLHGSLPPGVLRILRDWSQRPRADLLENWERARGASRLSVSGEPTWNELIKVSV
jgi:hypothetical protein